MFKYVSRKDGRNMYVNMFHVFFFLHLHSMVIALLFFAHYIIPLFGTFKNPSNPSIFFFM